MIETPVLLMIFNRPETTRRVFEAIRVAKPTKLYIAGDGPRAEKEGEIEKCLEARSVAKLVDWPCEVITRFQEKNLGCGPHVSSAISWFFDNVESGIVLEDDCLPDQSFFKFTDEMLKKYKDDARIMQVRGTNFQLGEQRGDGSYYFSRCAHVWGWASWKRAWKSYDLEMRQLNSFIESKKVHRLFKNEKIGNFWISLFTHIKEKKVNTWDAQWAFAILNAEGIVITPNVNLIENIGFGDDSTHTKNAPDIMKQKAGTIEHIVHPTNIEVDLEADQKEMELTYTMTRTKRIWQRITNYIKSCLGKS